MPIDPILKAIEQTREALQNNHNSRWIIGFSGGKDSSAMLKAIIAAYSQADPRPQELSVIYCDTGVENPVLDSYVKSLFKNLEKESLEKKLRLNMKILKPADQETFFVKVIGRGYPTPTNIFRWCTDKLRISPVTKFIHGSSAQDTIVCVGLRKSESQQRDRTLAKFENEIWQRKTGKSYNYRMFLPILELSIESVWDIIYMGGVPHTFVASKLEKIYRGATNECPIIKSPMAAPCSTGRFGCWTCTVVRKDKSMQNLIDSGHSELLPYLEFRNWIAEFRNDPEKRWRKRRNGADGMGPFTLSARKHILEKLDILSKKVGKELISQEERVAIHAHWEKDRDLENLFI